MSSPIPAELVADAPAFADELDEAIMLGSEIPERAQRFEVTDLGQAEWAMRKLAALTQRSAAVHGQASEWRERIDEWELSEQHRLDPSITYFQGLLERYALFVREVDGRATVALPSGEVATRKPKTPKITVVDEGAVIAWAADSLPGPVYDEVVRTEPKLMWSHLVKIVSTREVLRPFCMVCGVAIEVDPHAALDGDQTWDHDSSGENDHDAEPAVAFEVVWTDRDGNEVPVPGLTAVLGDTTAVAKPSR